MGPRLSLGGRVDVVYPSALIATRIVSVFMSVWFSFFFVDLRCFTSRSETLGPRTTTGVSQRWFSGHFRGRVLFIGTQFSILYTSMYSPAEAATPRA